MAEFTRKVAAAHALRSTEVVKKKLAHIACQFDELDGWIPQRCDEVIREVEALEEDIAAVRRGE